MQLEVGKFNASQKEEVGLKRCMLTLGKTITKKATRDPVAFIS